MGDWNHYQLKDIAYVNMGQSPAGSSVNENEDGAAFLQGNADFGEYHPCEQFWCSSPKKIARKDDIMISVRAPVGAVNVADKNYCIGRGLASIAFKICKAFALYALTYEVPQLHKKSQGSTFLAVNKKDIEEMLLNCPTDLLEQEKISRILQTLDSSIIKTKAIIEKYQSIKEGLLQDLLANGIDENGVIRSPKTHKYKDSPLGKIPVEWECVPFETVIEKLYDYRGRTPKKLGMEWGGDIPALSASNVCMGEIDFNKQTNYGSEKLYRKWMSQGDIHKDYIAFTMEAPLGNVALVPEERKYILSQRTIVFNCKQDICKNRYLYYYLASDSFQSYLQKYNSGTTAKGIQRKQLYKMFIVYPSKTREQEDIYRALKHIDSCLANAKKHLIKHQAIKTGLMQDLLTHKVPVDPLLERSVENE